MYKNEIDTEKFEERIPIVNSPLWIFQEHTKFEDNFFPNINRITEDYYDDINEFRQNENSFVKTCYQMEESLKNISCNKNRDMMSLILDNIKKLSNINDFKISSTNQSLKINLEVYFQKSEEINLNNITNDIPYFEDNKTYFQNINNIPNVAPLEENNKKPIFKLVKDVENGTFSDEDSVETRLSALEYTEKIVKKPTKKISSHKIKERWLKKVKVRIFKYILDISNNYIKKIMRPHEAKALFFKKINQHFIKNANIKINKKWNEKSLLNLFSTTFSNLDKNTQHNINSLNILNQNITSKIFLKFMKKTKIKDLIKSYLNSIAYRNDIKKLAEIFDEEGVEEFQFTVESYYDYYRFTPYNQKRNKK